ncbi:MAG: carbohydrate kinase family protein [Candidatus Parvarchaeum sp.]
MKLVIYGNIGFDDIVSIGEKKTVNGGAAYYCAAGAVQFSDSVGVVGVVGNDYDFKAVTRFGLSTEGIHKVEDIKSSHFSIKYGSNLRDRNIIVDIGAGGLLSPNAIPNDYMNDTKYFHITSIEPSKQMETIEFIRHHYPEVRISIDLIQDYIKEEIKTIKEIISNVDLVFLDVEEAKILNDNHIIIQKDFVLKKGHLGAEYVFFESGKRIYSPAPLITDMVDKTGSGDILAGALLSQLCFGTSSLSSAMANSVKCASEKVRHWGVNYVKKYNETTAGKMGTKNKSFGVL